MFNLMRQRLLTFLLSCSYWSPINILSPNFTGMIHGWSPFRVVEIIPLYAEFLLPWQPKGKKKQMNFGWPSTKVVQIILIGLKTWPPGGMNYFSFVNYMNYCKGDKSCKCGCLVCREFFPLILGSSCLCILMDFPIQMATIRMGLS